MKKKRKKKRELRYLQGGPRYRMWTRSVSWVRRSDRRRSHRKIKRYIFFSFRVFPWKAESVTLLGFEWTVNLQNLIDFVGVNLKNIFTVSGIFPGKADSFILLDFECTIKLQKCLKIVGAIFWENLNIFFFVNYPSFYSKSKIKKKTGNVDICRRALDIECGRGRSVGLGAPSGDGHTEKLKKYFFFSFRVFPWKAESVTLLGFEWTLNPQNLIHFVGTIFEKIENFIIFSYVNYP